MTKLFTRIAAVLVLAVACAPSKPEVKLVVTPASFDVAVGPTDRFLVGVTRVDNERFLAGGTVRMSFSTVDGKAGPTTTGTYLPVGDAKAPAKPSLVGPSGRGVYATQVAFDSPGVWKVRVEAVLDGRTIVADAPFQVRDRHALPYVGDAAIASENLTVASADAPREAIDSRARLANGAIPDEILHRTTVKAALEAKRPIVLIVSTPVFCESQFCGPVTDVVASLAGRYAAKAEFIHTEVWRDRQSNTVNKAAAEWIFRDDTLTEPWTWAIGADGKIAKRWDNVVTSGEIEAWLKTL